MFDLTLASIPFVGAKTLIQQAIAALRQIDGAHVYLPGEGSVLGMRAGNYIDSAGTLPGVLDSPVGLTLDALGVVGPELVTNGTFDTDVSGWPVSSGFGGSSATWSSGEMLLAATVNYNRVVQPISVVAGRTYLFKCSARVKIVSGSASAFIGYTAVADGSSSQPILVTNSASNVTNTVIHVATATGNLYIVAGTNDALGGETPTFAFDNISVKEITGIHASQNTTADKPKLTRRVNLLTKTEDFSDAAWVKQGTTTTPSANTILFQSDYQAITQAVAFAGGAAVGSSASFKVVLSGSGSCDIFVARSSGGTYEQTIVRVNLTNTPTQYAVTHTIQNPGQNGFVPGITRTPGATATLVTATNAALVPAANAHLPYQRVNTATDYATASFPDRWDFDATDTLNLTLPAGYESATVIDATSAGPVTLLEQDVTGTYGIVGGLTTVPELWTGTPPRIDANWTNNGDGSYTSNGASGLIGWPDGKCILGRTYESTFRVVSRTSGFAQGPYDGTGANGSPNILTLGVHKKAFVATRTNLAIYSGDFAGTVSEMSLKEILPSTHGRIILRDTPTPRQLELCQGLANRLAGL